MLTVIGEDTGFGNWAIVRGEFNWCGKRVIIDEPVNLQVTPYPGRFPEFDFVLDVIDMALCLADYFDTALYLPSAGDGALGYLAEINANFTVTANADKLIASCDSDWAGLS